MPLALDTYFRGDSHEVEFCRRAGAGGNHLVAVTAGGRRLGEGKGHRGHVRLRERDLAPLLAEYRALPEAERKPALPDPATATPAKRPVPVAPLNGLVVRGYCTYMTVGDRAKTQRAKYFYYKENPDAWAAETQSDMLWLTEAEWRSLIPPELEPGSKHPVAEPIQRRFFSTIGIDYMEGSVNALPVRESAMTLRVAKAEKGGHVLWLEGRGEMGKAYTASSKTEPRTRGCELEVIGRIAVNEDGEITAFDVTGVGEAWGNKMDYTRREIRIPGDRWGYGIACELVATQTPYDRVPPYNLLHYGGGMQYFGQE